MDPLTALSVAGTIVQFVDYETTLLSQASEFYKSPVGTLQSNHELELVTTDLRGLIVKLRQNFSAEGDLAISIEDAASRKSFEKLCNEAAKLAEELIERLDKVKRKEGKHSKWLSFKQAVESAWSKNEVADLKKRLMSFKKALETRVLFSIRRVTWYIFCTTLSYTIASERNSMHNLSRLHLYLMPSIGRLNKSYSPYCKAAATRRERYLERFASRWQLK